MLNAMTPPQGPYQQPNNPADNPILLVQQRDSSSSLVPTPSENSSSPVSSAASTTSSSSASTGSSTSSPSNLLSTATTTNQKAIASQQMSATSERLRDCDEMAIARAQDLPVDETGNDQHCQENGQQSADQADRLKRPVSPDGKRSSAQPDSHPNNTTTTSQDNSSKGQAESQPARVSDYATASSQAPPTALSTHQYQSAHPPVGYNPQYHHRQSQQQQQQNHNQHNTSNHYKPTGHHSQPYRSSRFNNHISHQQQQHHQHSNHSAQISHNSIKSSTTNTNSGSFSSIRSRNQRGHNNSHRHKNNHHQNHNQHHNHHNHNQQQQTTLLTNGNLNNREVQQGLSAPYSAAAASASPATSLSGSEIGARNTSSAMSRDSAAPTPAGPPHYVEMHVFAGECVAFQLMDGQEQIITGPATMTMVSQQESPPVPIPVQVPPGHTIHQVADENGTLRHIIFSVMNCEDGDHMNSNVIDFPHETFRVDSLGELVSTSGNSIGMDGDGSTSEQQAGSPYSKSTSASYEKVDPNYSMPHRHDTLNVGSAPIDDSRGAPHYKNMKSSYKHGSSRQVSSHPGRDKSTDFDRDRQQVIDSGRRLVREQPNYDMSGHNLSSSGMIPVGGADVGAEMDPSLMVNFGQMMPPSVDDQMYCYPNCACCCCYCDPNAEAAAAAAAAALAANNQPLSSPAQISAGSLIGQQDVIMMQQTEPQPPVPAPQHEARMVGSGSFRNGKTAANGNSTVYQNQHQANSMTNPSPHQQQQQQQQVFSSHPNLSPTKSSINASSTKANTNKAPRGAHHAKQQQGIKSHQSNYDRHHGNQQHHENQLAYNSVASSGSTRTQQVFVKEIVTSHKSSPAKQPVAQTNQQVANQANRSASEEKRPAPISSSTISKSPPAATSPARPAAVTSTSLNSNQKPRDPTPTPPVESEDQILEPALATETTAMNKKQNHPASDKSTTPRLAGNPIETSVKKEFESSSSLSSSSSPNRQTSESRHSPSAVRSSHQKNQESTLVNKKSHQHDDANKANTATDHQARPQPNSTAQRTASVTVAHKNDATRDDTPSVSSSMTRATKQSAKVIPIDTASHQQHQHSKQKQIDNSRRVEENVVVSQQEPSRRIKQKKHHHNHNQSQPIKVMSILKQCRNKLATNTGRVVQNLMSSYSDTKFAGLLLVIFTLFATFLAILIDHYIVAPVTE